MKSFKVLINKLDKNNILKYENEHGIFIDTGFKLNKPIKQNQIYDFQNQNFIELPKSYYEFLKISNGAELFLDLEYLSSGWKFYGLNEIIDLTNEKKNCGYNLKDSWIVFGEWYGNGDLLIFDLEKINTRKYIIDGDISNSETDWNYIYEDFEIFLNRLITVKGDMYWRW